MITVDRDTRLHAARLFYRHVNQAEEYRSLPLTKRDDALQAVVPGAYTASE